MRQRVYRDGVLIEERDFEPPVNTYVAPQIDGIVAKLKTCHACEQYDTTRSACKLLTRDGSPCVAELHQRIQKEQPCPHPAGDKWRT